MGHRMRPGSASTPPPPAMGRFGMLDFWIPAGSWRDRIPLDHVRDQHGITANTRLLRWPRRSDQLLDAVSAGVARLRDEIVSNNIKILIALGDDDLGPTRHGR